MKMTNEQLLERVRNDATMLYAYKSRLRAYEVLLGEFKTSSDAKRDAMVFSAIQTEIEFCKKCVEISEYAVERLKG